MGAPEGSCAGTDQPPLAGDKTHDRVGRTTGVCPVCFGRFRLRADGLIPNHAPVRER